MHGAGEQQEAEHAVHDRFIEIDLAQDVGDTLKQIEAGDEEIDQHDGERRDHAHGSKPILLGRRKTTWLSQPKMAVSRTSRAKRSKRESMRMTTMMRVMRPHAGPTTTNPRDR